MKISISFPKEFKILCFLSLLSSFSFSQNESNYRGIRWMEGLTWEQVKSKAQEENKYIFLDVYATWCSPCKAMDKNVYPKDSVGEYFNDKFISVKVQMDVTDKDNELAVARRKDAELIGREFKVDALPTFLFFSPKGKLIHKAMGFLTAGSFLTEARRATQPGKVYFDPDMANNQLMANYLAGKVPADTAFFLHEHFSTSRDFQKANVIAVDLYKFLTAQPFDSLFMPHRLKFIASITTRNTDRWFSLFYRHGKRVNRVMKDDNYSEKLVQGIILQNLVTPLLKLDMSGGMMANLDVAIKEDKSEADWVTLKKELRKQYNRYYTTRTLLITRFTWYHLHLNHSSFTNTYLKFLDNYGIGSHSWTSFMAINNFSYNLFFLQENDRSVLEKAIKWMKIAVEEEPLIEYLDTYAGLLYKVGRKKEALQWEKRAIEKASGNERTQHLVPLFESVVAKMEKGEKLNWKN